MAVLRVSAFAFLLAVGFAAKSAVTPLEKVLELLGNLKAEVEAEGKEEGDNYNKFACFCKEKTTSLSKSIVSGKDNINSLSAEIGEKTAEKKNTEEALALAKQRKEEVIKEIADKEAECAAGLAAYKAADADLTKAISSLEGAIETLESAKPVGSSAAAAGAAMLSVKASVKESLMLADALKIVEDGPKWAQATAFIQESSGVDPSDPDYKFHSHGIIKVLQDLLKDFTEKKNEADVAEKERAQNCVDTLEKLNEELDLLTAGILKFEQTIGELAEGIATARNSLVEADALLKDDQLYLKDLTEMCEARAKDFDQRSYTRSQELSTLTKALEVLGTTPEQAKRAALLLQSKHTAVEKAPVSFLQSVSEHHQHDAATSKSQDQANRRSHALKLLREAGGKLHSTTLLALSSRAASGPFEKVKVLIEKLIQRLVQEATEEATKKGYCDTSLAKAEKDRTFRYTSVMKLNADLEALEAKEDFLTAEIADLTADIAYLTEDLANVTDLRNAEKDANLATIKKDKEGAVVIKEAIMILESFYGEAAKAKENLGDYAQLQYSPTEDDTSGPGFEGNYAGKQDAMKGIMGLLEVLKSDFEREAKKTTEAEAEAHAAFVLYDRAAKGDISAKTTKKELDEEDLATTKATISSKMEEMQKNMDLVDQAVAELEALKPMCIDSGMSYEERVAKREEELEHLKTALCILDEAKVEDECK